VWCVGRCRIQVERDKHEGVAFLIDGQGNTSTIIGQYEGRCASRYAKFF